MYICIHTFVHKIWYIYTYASIHVCMYIYTYMYTYMKKKEKWERHSRRRCLRWTISERNKALSRSIVFLLPFLYPCFPNYRKSSTIDQYPQKIHLTSNPIYIPISVLLASQRFLVLLLLIYISILYMNLFYIMITM